MGLKETIANWLVGMGILQEAKGISGLDVLMGTETTEWHPNTSFERLSAEGYEYNAVIYACVTALMDAMEEAPILVEQQDRSGEWVEKPDSGLAKLLSRPNPDMSEDDLQSVTTLYLKLAGNAFWEKERSKAGRVVGLWPMRPDKVGIVIAASIPGQRVKHRILEYTWQGHTGMVRLPAKDVIHFKEFHPRDEVYGLPPLVAAAREGDTDNRATNFVGAFFNNAAVPKGILKIGARIDEAEEKRIQERLGKMFTGGSGWHMPMALGEGSEWIELGESFKDMDFPNLRQITETRLCMVFKVPPIIAGAYAGLEQSTYANYAEARRQFTQNTLIPMYRDFDTVLNRYLAPEFGDNIRARCDTSALSALEQDMNPVWARATAAFVAGAITVNDFREEVGLERVQEGDVFLRGLMLSEVPVTTEGQKVLMPMREVKTLPAASEDMLERQYKAFDLVARAWEGRFRAEAKVQFQRELEGIAAILRREGKKSLEGKSFDSFLTAVVAYLIDSRSLWAEGFLSLFTGLMGSQAEEVLGALGFSFDIESPEVQEFLHNYTINFAGEIASTTEVGVRGLIATAQEEGWSVPHLRGEITGLYDEFDRQRAEMIARTETIRSSNAGTQEAYRLAGIERKQWYASIDGRQCPFCEWLYMQYGPGTNGISMTENFVEVGGGVDVQLSDGTQRSMTITYGNVDYPPLHVNCRCRILAVTE